jgi:hypothetical protein
MHKKETIIAPIIEPALGWSVWVPADFDTDEFGTFTRETARAGTQLEAARAKARAAMERYGYPIGIASEGSFAAHPQMPIVQSNLELVVLLDDTAGVEVVGQARSNAVTSKEAVVQSAAAAVVQAKKWGFPEQGVILRRSRRSTRGMNKELRTEAALTTAVAQALRWPWVRSLMLETDMRAHRCPARQETIAAATRDMLSRYLQTCPQCQAPGFVGVAVATTATCNQCQRPTDVPYCEERVCQVCAYTERQTIPNATEYVDPGQCARCNP